MIQINKIYNENCFITMSNMPDNFIDLTITSPPYDQQRNYKDDLQWNFEIFKPIANELYRVTKKGGVVVWVVGDQTIKRSETGTSFKQALYFKQIGFNLHDTMIYQKNGIPFPESNRYYQCFEYMFIFSKGKPKSINLIADRINKNFGLISKKASFRQPDGSLKVKKSIPVKEKGIRWNIWIYDIGWMKSYKDSFLRGHPAIFPEKLAEDHIISWSNENDLVYDPFCGSGTVPKMCILNNRNYIGSEISKEYCDIIQKRIEGVQIVKQENNTNNRWNWKFWK